jgi:manganese transport protein
LDNLEAVQYNNIAVTIDFSRNDQDCIRHALMQGGKNAHYTLIHVVETAGARYYGKQVMDNETQSDVNNLDKYVDALTKLNYKAEAKIGYGGAGYCYCRNSEHFWHRFYSNGFARAQGAEGSYIWNHRKFSVRHKVNVPVLVVKPGAK